MREYLSSLSGDQLVGALIILVGCALGLLLIIMLIYLVCRNYMENTLKIAKAMEDKPGILFVEISTYFAYGIQALTLLGLMFNETIPYTIYALTVPSLIGMILCWIYRIRIEARPR